MFIGLLYDIWSSNNPRNMVILIGKSPTEAKYGPIGLKGLNKARNFYCPNLIVPVHRIISGKRKNCYHHPDRNGLLLSNKLEKNWASEMMKATGDTKKY